MIEFDASEVRKLAADLGAAGPKARQQAGRVVQASALKMVALAQQLAPVDTGNLRASIGKDQPAPFTAEVGPTANYGAFVEFGTHKMAPQPYLMPAADAITPEFEAAMAAIAADLL